MTAVQQSASVHPQTITEFSKNPTTRRRRANGRSLITPEGWGLQVHPELWAEALALCGGHPGRIEILDATNVMIHNNTGWRR